MKSKEGPQNGDVKWNGRGKPRPYTAHTNGERVS